MERLGVESSHIQEIGYEPTEAILEMEFKGGSVYQYYDVPQYEYDNLMSAESKGSYAHKNIYKNYRCQRIG
jgi:hypothetical protein